MPMIERSLIDGGCFRCAALCKPIISHWRSVKAFFLYRAWWRLVILKLGRLRVFFVLHLTGKSMIAQCEFAEDLFQVRIWRKADDRTTRTCGLFFPVDSRGKQMIEL